VDLSALGERGFKVIGNLPYNISGALFDWLVEYRRHISLAVITVQKEVGNRVRARPGSRDYGSLSVLIQMHYEVSRLFDISPGCFSPKPKVTSTVVRLVPEPKLAPETDYASFREFIYSCFSQKRKTLVNSLGSSMNLDKPDLEKTLVSLGKRTDIRAEQLSGQEFLVLYGKISGDG
jgi:16S rRNA (adenine1518-N6/adenine1519-N6)-dimethyltransferase